MVSLDSRKLKNISKPARYVGGEVNTIIKEKNVKYNIVLCYPNLYEKGMSNYILNMLYTNINRNENIWCKRCFMPDTDFEKYLRDYKYKLYALEDYSSLDKNDMLIFIIEDELDYTNLLAMFKLGNILTRKNEMPKICLYTKSDVNIKPIKKYFDYIFNDESEKDNTKGLINVIQENSGVNIDHSRFDVKYLSNRIVPSIKINNSSNIIDFNYITDEEKILKYVINFINQTGINTVSFRNIDKIDRYKFCEIVYRLKSNIDGIKIISKNIDFNTFETQMLDVLLPCIERSAVLFDVFTCSKKIKEKIGIGTDKSVLIQKINKVFKNNRNSIRLKFYIGLPDETYEDIDNIFELLEEIVNMYSTNKAKDKFSMNVKLNYYIPSKTEENTCVINGINKLETKIRYIKEKMYDSVINIEVEDIDSYITKTLLKNAEENIEKVIYDAYILGARFDGDSKKYNKSAWEKSIYDNIGITSKYIK